MLRYSCAHRGLISIVKQELQKFPAYARYQAVTKARNQMKSAAKGIDFLKGVDRDENAEMAEKRQKHRAMYEAILQKQAEKVREENAKARAAMPSMSWKEKLQFTWNEAKEAMQQMTSTNAGVMALLQHCTASHAAEVAVEQGIEVKDVSMVLEKRAKPNGVGYEEVVVGYIDAPSASEEEVMAFAHRLQKACPMANQMQERIVWSAAGKASDAKPSSYSEHAGPSENVLHMHGNDGGGVGNESGILDGMPGTGRYSRSSFTQGDLFYTRVSDDLHLPGIPSVAHAAYKNQQSPPRTETATPEPHATVTPTTDEPLKVNNTLPADEATKTPTTTKCNGK